MASLLRATGQSGLDPFEPLIHLATAGLFASYLRIEERDLEAGGLN